MFNVVVERDTATGLYVGHVPGLVGAHSQGADQEELRSTLADVITMLLEDGDPVFEAEFIGIETVSV
jgi:predicted RNase H-like HicB family nuclease